MIEGNRKKIKMVNALKLPLILIGEFTILDEPTVPVMESQIPADVADKRKAIIKKIAA